MKYDFCLISDKKDVIARVKSLCEDYQFSLKHYEGLEPFMEAKDEYVFSLASLNGFDKKESGAELAQAMRYASKDCYITTTISGKLGIEAAEFAKKSGANLILLDEEVCGSSKLDFICLNVIRSNFIPLKVTDLAKDKAVTFDIYHLMPQRQKFLKFIFSGDVIDEKRIEKCKQVGELYISRSDAIAYKDYIKGINDMSRAGLARRCRSQFLALYASYTDLILLLTDQAEHMSFSGGLGYLEKCNSMCGELIGALGEFGDASEIINNSSVGEMGSIERAPAIAAYVAVLGLQADFDKLDSIMLASLLTDLALIMMPPSVMKKLKNRAIASFTTEERAIYEKYPQMSLDLILNRKIPLDEKIRHMILSTHERADGKGFPKRPQAEKIGLGAQLINFSREYDQRTLIRMGEARPDPKKVIKQMVDEDYGKFNKWTADFMKKLRDNLGI